MRSDSLGLFWEDLGKIKTAKLEKRTREKPDPVWENDDYLPFLEEARQTKYNLMTDAELVWCQMAQHEMVFDTEVYKNYFLAVFTSLVTGKSVIFELDEDGGVPINIPKFEWVLKSFTLVTFNGIRFDLPICALVVAGCGNEQLKQATNLLIGKKKDGIKGMRAKDVLKLFKAKAIEGIDQIDLIEVCPLQASLKMYGGRLHAPRMQDLPFAHDKVLNNDQKLILKWYCVNDITTTAWLRMNLREQIDLRKKMTAEYGIDLRSKSDAQIAEAVFTSEVEAIKGKRIRKPTIDPGTTYRYDPPSYIKFKSDLGRWVLDQVRAAEFIVKDNGDVYSHVLANLLVKMGDNAYQMGMGGLHSTEKKTAHVASATRKIKDTDFDSFYPKLILGQRLYPEQMGPAFLTVYEKIVDRRLHAKRVKDKSTANSLKIVINGSFGKLGSMFSNLYAPKLLLQVTVTGQLILLMAIEALELSGISVVSANTDGVVAVVPEHLEATFQSVWEQIRGVTRFTTEETEYSALYSKDVNNYIAVKVPEKDGKVKLKGKGTYSNHWHPDNKDDAIFRFHKNPSRLVCTDAIFALLKYGTPVEDTIRNCSDVTKFVSVKHVDGGAVKPLASRVPDHTTEAELIKKAKFLEVSEGFWTKGGDNAPIYKQKDAYQLARRELTVSDGYDYLGGSVRWYYSRDESEDIMYASNGHSVGLSQGARPIMTLPDAVPDDVDYDWYITEANRMLRDIAYAS